MGPDIVTVPLGIFAIAFLFVLVVTWWRRARRRSRTPDDSVITRFTHELFAAQTTPDVKGVVARRLPEVVGTDRLWVSGFAGGRRQMIVPGDGDGASEQRLTADFQEWTTVPLRAGEHVVGLMGVESTHARSGAVRRAMATMAPLIGQALQNAASTDLLREASLVDSLTGTATRREGLARLHAELKRAQRTGASTAVMLLDLDRFKAINDRCGHAMGDAVLTAVGQTLRRTLRASDIRCRWGGEEFLVVLPDTDLERARVVAQGLLRNIAAATVPTPNGPVGSTTSIGLTMTRPGELNLEAILQRADMALYRAKHAGRGCVEVAADSSAGESVTTAPQPAGGTGERTLPFPDRRNPGRRDRRQVPGPGRRATDPQPASSTQLK